MGYVSYKRHPRQIQPSARPVIQNGGSRKNGSQEAKHELKVHKNVAKGIDTSGEDFKSSSSLPSPRIVARQLRTSKPELNPEHKAGKLLSPRIKSLRQDLQSLDSEHVQTFKSPQFLRLCSCLERFKDEECSCPNIHQQENRSFSASDTVRYSVERVENINMEPGSPLSLRDSAHPYSRLSKERHTSKDAETHSIGSLPGNSPSSINGEPCTPQYQRKILDKSQASENSPHPVEEFHVQQEETDSGFEENPDSSAVSITSSNDGYVPIYLEKARTLCNSEQESFGELTWTSIQTRTISTGTDGKLSQQRWSCAELHQKLMDIVFVEKKIPFDRILDMPITDDSIRKFYYDLLPDYFDLPLSALKLIFKYFYADAKDRNSKESVEEQKEKWSIELKDTFYIYNDKIRAGMSPKDAIKEACSLVKVRKATEDESTAIVSCQKEKLSEGGMGEMIGSLRIRGGQGAEKSSIDSTASAYSAISSTIFGETQQIGDEEQRGRSSTPTPLLKRQHRDDDLSISQHNTPPRKRARVERRVHFERCAPFESDDGSVSSEPEPSWVTDGLEKSAARTRLAQNGYRFDKKKSVVGGTRGKAVKSHGNKPAAASFLFNSKANQVDKLVAETNHQEEGKRNNYSS